MRNFSPPIILKLTSTNIPGKEITSLLNLINLKIGLESGIMNLLLYDKSSRVTILQMILSIKESSIPKELASLKVAQTLIEYYSELKKSTQEKIKISIY